MNLKLLQSEQKGIQQLNSERRAQAESYLATGLSCLAEAYQQGFKAKGRLTEACEALLKAIQYDRRSLDAHLGMASLFLLLGTPRAAVPYLQEVLRLAPDHPDATAMLAGIQTWNSLTPTAPASGPLAGVPVAEPRLNPDELYEKTESLIYAQLRQMAARKLLEVSPSRYPDQQRSLRETHRELKSVQNQLEQQLGILEQDLDVSELRSRMRGLESLIRRYETCLKLSAAFETTYLAIRQCTAQTRALLQGHLEQADLPRLEQALEPILDACDAFADQLDAWSEAKHDISSIEPAYAELVAEIEKTQELTG